MGDSNSVINQRVMCRLVEREVLGCFTREVSYILSHPDRHEAPFGYEDVENLARPCCADCGSGYTNFTQVEDDDGDIAHICDDCGREYSDDEFCLLDLDTAEVYEWWAVSGFLAEKLSEHGHCVIDGPCVHYWGRPTTGQAILLDSVIASICMQMGILDGQENSWSALV